MCGVLARVVWGLAILLWAQAGAAAEPAKPAQAPASGPTVRITLGPVPSSASRPIVLPPRPVTPPRPQATAPPAAKAASVRPAHGANRPNSLAGAAGPGADSSDQAGPVADADIEVRIVTPTQGRPIFAQSSSPITCLLRLNEGEQPRLFLQNSLVGKLRYPLLPGSPAKKFGDGYIEADMSIAGSTPPGLYDLVLAAAGQEIVNRRSVCVVEEFRTSFRFVHLSNMNIGDPTAADFDPRIPEEVNLLAPEFIVATGDFTEWARLCDHPADWQRVLDYLAQFEAPVYVLCGDHDHQASFTRLVANSPVGTIDYGKYHGLLLLDHGEHPIDRDDDQVRWVLQDLEANRSRAFNFVVTHSDELGLIRRLRDLNVAELAVHDLKLRMIICGGQTDWDYREFASLLSGLPGLHYIRTGQSSTAVRDRANGESHYRVIEVNNERVSYVYPTESFDPRTQYSVPAGRLHVTFAVPNDGTTDPVTVNVASTQNRSWNDCRIWLRVRKQEGNGKPAVVGGTLLRCLDGGSWWACQVGFDLPDKGAVTVQAGSPDRLTPTLPVRLEFSCPEQLAFAPRTASYDLTYYACPGPVILKVVNGSNQAQQAWPIVRLNGANLSLSGSGPQPLPLTLMPMSSQVLRVNLTLGQLALGPHSLQAYLLEDPLRRLSTQPVVLLLAQERPQGPGPATQIGGRPGRAAGPAPGHRARRGCFATSQRGHRQVASFQRQGSVKQQVNPPEGRECQAAQHRKIRSAMARKSSPGPTVSCG